MQVTLTHDIENVITEWAHKQGTTPEILVINTLREKFVSPAINKGLSKNKCVTSRLSIRSSSKACDLRHSELCRKEHNAAGRDEAATECNSYFLTAPKLQIEKQKTLSDFLVGHVGVLSSGEYIAGEARMSEDCGKKFASGLIKKRQDGKL